MKAWEENPDPEASIDCCTVHVFSWGHAAGAVHHRRSAEYSFPKDAPPLPPSRQERNINPPFPEPPKICRDFSVKSAERPKRWTNADLWLSDTDCDWHMPLLFTLKEMTQRAKRARSKAAHYARRAVQRSRQQERASGSSRASRPPSRCAGPPSRSHPEAQPEPDVEDFEEQEEEEQMELYSDHVPQQPPGEQRAPPEVRPNFPPGELSPEVQRLIRDILYKAKSFTVLHVPKQNIPRTLFRPKVTITSTSPVLQGPPVKTMFRKKHTVARRTLSRLAPETLH